MSKFLYDKPLSHTSKSEKKDALAKWWDEDGADDYYGQGDLFDDYDYEESSSKKGAASDWWRGYFGRKGKWGSNSYSSGYGGDDVPFENEESAQNIMLREELKQVARTVNAVRNTSGSLKRERNLKVAWAGQGYGRQDHNRNNMRQTSTLYLSPDPLTEKGTIKADWSEGQKRDALVGEALSLTAMKRLVQPTHVKQIMNNKVTDEQIKTLSLLEIDERERAIQLMIARELWKSLETYTAQQDLLQDYRGCRAYFAAYLAFYSDSGYKQKLLDSMEEPEKINALRAAAVLCWNINHFQQNKDQISPPPGDVEEIMIEAFEILMDGLNVRSTAQRWEKAVEAAQVLRDLDPEGKDQEEEWLQQASQDGDEYMKGANGKNGNTDNMFGDQVQNQTGANGQVDCDELEDDDVTSSGLSQFSERAQDMDIKDSMLSSDDPYSSRDRGTQGIVARSMDELDEKIENIRAQLAPVMNAFRRAVEPYAQLPVLPEYGMRSGRLSRSSLWKVTTNLVDNDRVFFRKVTQGVTNKVSIGLLLDYSGSTHGGVLDAEKRVAVLLHDVLQRFPQVDLHLYGHEDRNVNRVYCFESLRGVVGYGSHGGTNEGTALARAAQHLHQNSQKGTRKILFAIGDGCSSPQEIKDSVKAIRRSGMEVYDILVSNYGYGEQAVECYGEGRVVTLDPWSEASELGIDVRCRWSHDSSEPDNPLMDVLMGQLTRILKPWMCQMFARLSNMGGV